MNVLPHTVHYIPHTSKNVHIFEVVVNTLNISSANDEGLLIQGILASLDYLCLRMGYDPPLGTLGQQL